MNNFNRKNLIGVGVAAVMVGGLAAGAHIANGGSVLGIGTVDFETQVELALPNANMQKADRISDTLCNQGLLAAAFQLNNVSDQTGQATVALTVHKCKNDFLNQMESFAQAFGGADDPDFQAGLQAVKQMDPDDAQSILAFATTDGQVS